MRVWIGLGYQVGVDWGEVEGAIERICREAGLEMAAVAGVGTIDRKLGDRGLVALCRRRGWDLLGFAAAELARVELAGGSESGRVAAIVGTPSVAVAAAMLAAARWGKPTLWVEKQVLRLQGKAVTIAVAAIQAESS